MADGSCDDFSPEWPKDNDSEVDIDIHDSCAVSDEAFRGRDDRVEAHAQANFVNDLVGILGVDEVFD